MPLWFGTCSRVACGYLASPSARPVFVGIFVGERTVDKVSDKVSDKRNVNEEALNTNECLQD